MDNDYVGNQPEAWKEYCGVLEQCNLNDVENGLKHQKINLSIIYLPVNFVNWLNTVEKKRENSFPAFSFFFFLTLFSTLPQKNIIILETFKSSSANAFN